MNQLKVYEFPPCAICEEDLISNLFYVQKCGHIFHKLCIEKCISMNSRCPVCREPSKTIKKLHFNIIVKYFQNEEFNLQALEQSNNSNDQIEFFKKKFTDLFYQNEDLERKLQNKRNENEKLNKQIQDLKSKYKNESEKWHTFTNLKHKTESDKKGLEKENLILKQRLEDLGKENKRIREIQNTFSLENKILNERINIFENCNNIQDIEKYITDLNSNEYNSLEEKNIILTDIIRSIMKLKDKKLSNTEVIDLISNSENSESKKTSTNLDNMREEATVTSCSNYSNLFTNNLNNNSNNVNSNTKKKGGFLQNNSLYLFQVGELNNTSRLLNENSNSNMTLLSQKSQKSQKSQMTQKTESSNNISSRSSSISKSPILGNKTKRRYSKLKSLVKDNMTQLTINKMLSKK